MTSFRPTAETRFGKLGRLDYALIASAQKPLTTSQCFFGYSGASDTCALCPKFNIFTGNPASYACAARSWTALAGTMMTAAEQRYSRGVAFDVHGSSEGSKSLSPAISRVSGRGRQKSMRRTLKLRENTTVTTSPESNFRRYPRRPAVNGVCRAQGVKLRMTAHLARGRDWMSRQWSIVAMSDRHKKRPTVQQFGVQVRAGGD